jgi:hypothetical protein
MKAMLEPTIVAARIQGPACVLHGISALLDWSTASSHGVFMETMESLSQR